MSRRLEILRRATEVFERQGVNRTSLEDIAKAVGIKREAIYYYFKGRTEILLRIILPQSSRLVSGLQSILDSNLGSHQMLHAAVCNHIESFNPNYLEMAVALREKPFAEEDGKLDELRRVWRDYDRLWGELVRKGQSNGAFRPDLDPKIVAYGLLGMCNWLARWYDPAKRITIPTIIETFFAMMSDGLCLAARPVNPSDFSPDRLGHLSSPLNRSSENETRS